MRPIHVLATAPVTLALAACGIDGPEPACTAIGAPAGLGVDIAPGTASSASLAVLTACWMGDCHTVRADLRDGDNGRTGFADIIGLPTQRVEVTLVLLDQDGRPVLDENLELIPEATYPNGPDCGAGGAQARLVVDATGAVTSG